MRYSLVVSMSLVGFGMLISTVAQATNYDEAVNGDLSGDRLNPTPIALTLGSNRITASSQSGDLEYFHVTIPAGKRLGAIVVVSNTSANLSFIGVQSGTTFTEPPTGTNVANLLGYSHFGVGNTTIGKDILGLMGTGSGAIDFVPPLGSGDFTFWSQETAATASTYTLDFQVIGGAAAAPIPPVAIGFLALGLGFIGLRLVRRRAR